MAWKRSGSLRRSAVSLLWLLSVAGKGTALEPDVCQPLACAGDCNESGAVTVDELLQAVSFALADQSPAACSSVDGDDDDAVSIHELTTVVQRLVHGCEIRPLERTPETLVDHLFWQMVPEGDDLWAPIRPEGATCASGAFRFEILSGEESLEVKTEECSYLTVAQPIRTAVRAGDELYIRLWHFQLTAPSGGLAQMAVAVGDCLIWEEQRRIPTPSELLVASVIAPFGIPEGTPVSFHVQNHGANSYHLVEVSVGGSILGE